MRIRRQGLRVARSRMTVVVTLALACGGRSLSSDQGEGGNLGGERSSSGGIAGETSTAGVGGTSTFGGSPSRGGQNASGASGAGGGSAGDCPWTGNPIECKGIVEGSPCPFLECAECGGLFCGLARSGTRDCKCLNGTWQCTPCQCGPSAFCAQPPEILPCPNDAADENPCGYENTVCGPVGDEFCACYRHPVDGLIWDCALPPPDWNF